VHLFAFRLEFWLSNGGCYQAFDAATYQDSFTGYFWFAWGEVSQFEKHAKTSP
jgi:hypothetical protein